MAERLTVKDEKGTAFLKESDMKDPCEFCYEATQKLAHYEDLEEQGRLIIVPESFNVKEAIEGLSEHFCPPAFGINNFTEQCGLDNCKGCWEAALKGAENDNL